MAKENREELPLEILEKILVEQPLIKVRLDTRKFGKPVTIIDGLPNDKDLLKQLAKFFKIKLATGGTFREENGRIELQGDQRLRVRQILIEQLGLNPENVIVM